MKNSTYTADKNKKSSRILPEGIRELFYEQSI